jgi:hypothetical protein
VIYLSGLFLVDGANTKFASTITSLTYKLLTVLVEKQNSKPTVPIKHCFKTHVAYGYVLLVI